MIGRDVERLQRMHDQARRIVLSLQREPYQHPRISLPIGEALMHASRLEAFLADAVETVEAELYRPGFSD